MIRLFQRIFITLILCVWAGMTYSQPLPENENQVVFKRHSIGFQLNPYPGRNAGSFPSFDSYVLRSTVRYDYLASPKVSLGAEISATHNQLGQDRYYSTLGLGTFSRYWFWQKPYIRAGAEGNVFITKRFYQLPDDRFYDLYLEGFKQEYHFMYFISPVISLSKKESRWSFDLMYKFTHQIEMSYWDKSVFSYRINYHF
jgi:hypothetical protein